MGTTNSGPARKPWPALCVGLVLVVVTLGLYAPVGGYEFLCFDDEDYVTLNPQVQRGLTLAGVQWAFNVGHASNWHPVTWLSHMLDCELFGLNAGAHHLVSAGLHALNALILFLVLAEMTGRMGRSALVAALFAWHPLHVESVAWVAERKDVLSAFFGLLSLGAYGRYARGAGRGWWKVSVVMFALGLGSKPMLVTLPCVFLLLDVWPLGRLGPPPWGTRGAGRAWLQLIGEKWPFFALAAASCLLTMRAQEEGLASGEHFGWGERLSNALVSYVAYLGKAFWPVDLAVFYPHPGLREWWVWVGAGVLLLALTGLAVKAAGRQPWLLVGWLWYAGMLVPVIGLVQVGLQGMADRYTYLPLTGVFIMVVWGVAERCGPVPGMALAARVLAVAVLGACVGLTSRQLAHWRNSVTLFEHALRVTPDNAPARYTLGVAYQRAGKQLEAERHYFRAIELDTVRPQGFRPLAFAGLGHMAHEQGRHADAVRFYAEGLRHDPENADMRWNLGVSLLALGNVEAGFGHLRQAARLKADDAQAQYALGMEMIRARRGAEAVEWLAAAARLRPEWMEPRLMLAWVLATHPDGRVRNGARAVELAARAGELGGAGAVPPLDALGAALAESGQYERAAELAGRAAELARAAGQDRLAGEIEARAAGYRRGQPHRDPSLAPAHAPGDN